MSGLFVLDVDRQSKAVKYKQILPYHVQDYVTRVIIFKI
jgi:hypothetical protein